MKVFKYATGQEVPEGATYLYSCKNGTMIDNDQYPEDYMFVWHYFLIK